ncbi:MAG: sigma 54-interacting transcriptional regulator [Gammaproteobacteria bacterium]|nr:sigma 54-interacting transcriptional regulator [Gammaproteobacteria bacterium]MDH5513606.1 sigma 54-interacting transcriptional regulator [Gammaproteobacteria bacterium]
MAQNNKKASTIDLQSLVDSHEKPYVVIDRDYRVLAANKAYEQVYGRAREWAIGKTCFQVSHGNDKPCSEMGEDCPHQQVFSSGDPYSCLHIHYDSEHRMHQVRVTAHPLSGPDGLLYMGETVEELSARVDCSNAEDRMVGQSKPFLAYMEQLKLAADSDATVLLQGETGTGKELGAKFIHDQSVRKASPFMVVDCTVLTESLFESEVFGHVRGAFTGSMGEKAGLFEQAEGGTLCLDEIGELPMQLQAKLLRVLETGQYRRVGGHKTLKSDVRIICSTNRHLWERVLAGKFREDLYYRIACLNIRVPNLRERLDDIPLLTENLLECAGRAMQRSYHLTDDAVQALVGYHYPGNIRELRNILSVAATHCSNGTINTDNIRQVISQLTVARVRNMDAEDEVAGAGIRASARRPEKPAAQGLSSLQAVEARHINALLARCEGNRKRVAAELGVSERTLYRKLKRYALNGV